MFFTRSHSAAISEQLHTIPSMDTNAQILALTSVIGELTARRDTLIAAGTVEGTDRPLTAAWLTRNTGLGGHTANRIINHSRLYAQFPTLADAVTAGKISADHVGALARLLPRTATAHRTALVTESIGDLIDLAKGTSVKEFATKCGEYAQICNETDPDISGPDPAKLGVTAADNNDGTTTITLTLQTLRARVFLGALDAVVEALSKADRTAAKETESDPQGDPFGADTETTGTGGQASDEDLINNWSFGNPIPAFGARTRGQRIGTALALMGRAAVTVPDGADLVSETIVNITMDWDTFTTGLAQLQEPDDTPDLNKVLANPNYRSRTIEGIPIPRSQILMAAIMSRVRRVVFGSTSRKVDVGRSQRLFTDAARIGLLIKYGGCSECGKSFGKIEIDHLIDWALGGTTDSENAGPKCWDCHHDKTAQTHPDHDNYTKAA